MKIAIDIGHNAPPDTGASGLKNEDEINKLIGHSLSKKLKERNHEVYLVGPSSALTVRDSLKVRCAKSNAWGADLFISIHNNCFNQKAFGTECFALSQKGYLFASAIHRRLVSLGFYGRGIKDGGHLFVIKHTNAPAVLVECFFVDSLRDCAIFDSLGPEKIAEAIAGGICEAATN
jgi:N-acetylmuramoyl-L-alanine amidase